tara:strand:- start:377 stop:2164 length:1788 start_codon:yes stop_codon:yes gene_type:complete
MNYIFTILFFFLSNFVFASDTENTEVEVINLYEAKSLDQMVLENIKNEEDNVENEINEKSKEDEDVTIDNDDTDVNENKIEEADIVKASLFLQYDSKDIKNYFDNLGNINSKTLQEELIIILENLELNFNDEQDQKLFFLIVNYFKSIGQINKSYDLIEKYDLNNDINLNYYINIKINFLLSTLQLNEACEFKEDLDENTKLDFFLLEKLDIFCLILNNNESEASLLNSILIETEIKSDNYFQLLYSLITDPTEKLKSDILNNNKEINSELIFLYSAMTRIAELPFSKEFYFLDKKNLAIPIILNQASPIDLRINAANESFLNNVISIESLAALYMSVDFNAEQLNNPEQTIPSLSDNKELGLAYFYQLINIQIFPSDRLKALVQFWDFAKKNNLEEIAFKLSNNMLNSIEATSESIVYAPEIASAYIFNDDFEKAEKWIELYENSKDIDSKSIYIRILLDLYSSFDLTSFINSLNLTLNSFKDYDDNQDEELLFVLKDVMNLDSKYKTNINFSKIFDDRSMPSIFLFNEIKNSLVNNDNQRFLIYSLISLNSKEWNDIHPEHLKIILNGYLKYDDGKLFRNLILEIFKNYNFIL